MIANLLAALLPFFPMTQSTTDAATTPVAAPVQSEAAPAMLYVWAHSRCDLPAAVAMARRQGFVPTSGAIFQSWVPEACGPAWVVYVRPVF